VNVWSGETVWVSQLCSYVNILVQECKWLKYVDMASQLHLQYLKQKNMFRAIILPCQAVGFFLIFSPWLIK
jgi:hypothetical protein